MEPPTIHVQDTDRDLTLRYVHGDNEIDLKAVYTAVFSLYKHPGREDRDPDGNVIGSSEAFLESFWSGAASLLDYFADFYATDTALMQSVWFHILDEWQRARPPLRAEDYNRTLDVFNRLINPGFRPQETNPGDPVIHHPSGIAQGPGGAYETGPFISGLKPWQQFLCSGAPGFKPAPLETTLAAASEGPPTIPGTTTGGGPPTNVAAANEDPPTRYIPQPGIALINTHTERARRLLAKLKEKENRDDLAALAAFDASSVRFPSALHHTLTRPSLTQADKTLSYQLVQGAPPVKRHEGLTDPSMLVDKPDLTLCDEAVGLFKGREAYVPMTGPVAQDGVGFDVWAVREKDGQGLGSGAADERKRALAAAMETLFDDWEFPGEKW